MQGDAAQNLYNNLLKKLTNSYEADKIKGNNQENLFITIIKNFEKRSTFTQLIEFTRFSDIVASKEVKKNTVLRYI